MRHKLKVMVTYPPLRSQKGVAMLGQNRQFQWFSLPSCLYPVVFASAATLLNTKGYEVIWKDAIAEGMSEQSYQRFVFQQRPDIIFIETKTPVIKLIWELVDKIKKEMPGTIVALVGDHVTAKPKETLEKSRADYVLTGGDYDFAILNLCEHLSGKEILEPGVWHRDGKRIGSTGKMRLYHNLDTLPFADRNLTKEHLYMNERNMKFRPYAYTMAGRDCPYHKCRFCSWTTLYPSFRVRSVENYLEEVSYLINNRQVKEIFDDTGTFPTGKWLENFCKGMEKKGYSKRVRISCNMRADYITRDLAQMMKKAGFRLIKVGLESANQETLDAINKGTTVQEIYDGCRHAKEAGLEVHLTAMVGYPWENREHALKTIAMTKELLDKGYADVFQSTVVVPYPGTPFYQEAISKGWFRIDPDDYEKYDMRAPVLKTGDMTSEEVTMHCNRMYRIYFSPKYVARTLAGTRPSDFRYLARGAFAVAGHLKDFRDTEC